MAKLAGKDMVDETRLVSEGAALDEFLDELQREHEVREIAGWDTGFANLNRALDGVFPGLYLLIGRPACGKTSFAKQLLDQVAMRNNAIGVFFSFAESKQELRIKTLARLSGMENREIRRGSAYLLHWYGVPRLAGNETEQLSPSWERVRRAAENARNWLDSIFLLECGKGATVETLAAPLCGIRAPMDKRDVMVVIDDCQRLGAGDQPLEARLPFVTEQLQSLAKDANAALFAVWPDLRENGGVAPQTWAERALGADVVMVIEEDAERTKKLSEPNQALTLNVVKNRGGERGKLAFDFLPAFSQFVEAAAR
jgi:replicative DNA helicase